MKLLIGTYYVDIWMKYFIVILMNIQLQNKQTDIGIAYAIYVMWTCSNFVMILGESVDDCGGGYSESIAEMCDELQNGSLPLLIVTPNGRGESGANRDCYLLNPMLKAPQHINMFRFLGEKCS